MGSVFEAKRRFWIIPNYANNKEAIQQYFEKQGCKIKIKVKHDEKIFSHQQKSNYKEDKELQSFIKIMTLQGAGARTIDNYACQISKLKAYYPNKGVLEISNNEIIDYLFFLREELSYSTSAQNIAVSAIKRFLQAFGDHELTDIRIPRPKHKTALPKVLEKKEIETLLKLNIYPKHKCMLYLMYASGIRCGELINLKVEDVDFNKNVIVINKGKGNKSRIVGLSNKMRDLLLRYLRTEQPNIHFFEGLNGGRYSASSIRSVVKNAARKAGIDKRVTPHMLRHSFATHLHDSGMDIRNIQKLLGHSNTKTTEIYTQISNKDISRLKSPLDDLDI
ncbi:site-specific tyrosine recombinase/integron integrase [Carboxylicivirga sp. N1Y90]|uniref:site-specific tyrosine recombinase/integron integrase n=1 Tax=Carboxylicivirga fragile TaxID=3417571 RepID=UPI003D351F69